MALFPIVLAYVCGRVVSILLFILLGYYVGRNYILSVLMRSFFDKSNFFQYSLVVFF